MKKITGLITATLFAGLVNAQVDTLPMPRLDTGIRKMDSLPQEQWNRKDSNLGKWNADTAASLKSIDSMQSNQWSKQSGAAADTTTGRLTTNDSSSSNKKVSTDTTTAIKLPDRVMMKDGKMFIVEKGAERKLEKDFVFASGLVVTPEGVVKKKDGSSVQLKDGQYLEIKPAAVKKEKAPVKKAPVKKSKQ
jgi:hypothetical protein